MTVRYFILLSIIISAKSVVGQPQTDEIKRLQKIAKENEERALKAEAEAERNLVAAEYAEKDAKLKRYIIE
jgi:hypothetical protein